MVGMLAIGVPMYVCATASTPIAAALVAKGLDPGAALVFLLAGPATNLATIAVVRGFLGGRVLAVYLVSIVAFSLLCGALIGPLYTAFGMDASASMSAAAESGLGWFDVAGGVVMVALLLHSARRIHLHRTWWASVSGRLARIGISPGWARTLLVSAALLAYASTSVAVVQVGETGFLTRFGQVVRTREEPGLVLHLPYPLERLEVVRTDEIRGVHVGFEDDDETRSDEPDRISEVTEVVTGAETLLQVPYAVHYTVTDAYRHRFEVAAPVDLVVALSSTAIQQAVSRRTTDDILVNRREELELEITRMLNDELSSVQAGVRVLAMRLGSIHAPPAVHDAFRDVASALEDKARFEHEALAESDAHPAAAAIVQAQARGAPAGEGLTVEGEQVPVAEVLVVLGPEGVSE